MRKKHASIVLFVSLLVLGQAPGSQAFYWPVEGVAVCSESGEQLGSQLTVDGTGGAIVTWQDWRVSPDSRVYVQRLNRLGEAQWLPGGIWISSSSGDASLPQIASDGLGGAYVAWQEQHSNYYDIYAQHMDADGNPLWANGGIPICTADSNQVNVLIVADGDNGAIVSWVDERADFDQIYTQRVDAAGSVLWAVDGVSVCDTVSGDQGFHECIYDSLGGEIITWMDWRNEAADLGDIYAQRIDATGNRYWDAAGVGVCVVDSLQRYPNLVSDGDSGAIITWADYRVGFRGDIYAQRIQADGAMPTGAGYDWQVNGTAVCDDIQKQRAPTIVSDGVGGAIITWMDNRDDSVDYDIFGQRIDSFGMDVWPVANGTPISQVHGVEQKLPHIISDGEGGAIVVWRQGGPGFYDLYAQRIAADGLTPPTGPLWEEGGHAICTFAGSQLRPQIVATGVGMGIAVWEDRRDEGTQGLDVYSNIVRYRGWSSVGEDGLPLAPLRLGDNYPNPFNPRTTIAFGLPEKETVSLHVYDVAGRLVRVLVDGEACPEGRQEAVWNGRNDRGRQMASGTYFYRLTAGNYSETKRMVLVK